MAKKRTSEYILSTAANLLGFCLFILTSLHLSDKTETFVVDELTAIVALLLTVSSGLSFIAIRTENEQKSLRLEKSADVFFLMAMIGVLIIVTYLTVHFLQNY